MTEVNKFAAYCLSFGIGKITSMRGRPGSQPMEGFLAPRTDALVDRINSQARTDWCSLRTIVQKSEHEGDSNEHN